MCPNNSKNALKYTKSRQSYILTFKKKEKLARWIFTKYSVNYVERFWARLEVENGCVIGMSVRLFACIR
jgi:hypothetical protein